MKLSEISLKRRVARGAALLDAECPGWAARINTAHLGMLSCFDCVLGQLYGHSATGRRALSLMGGPPEGYGFDGSRIDAAPLRDLWLAEIGRRRVAQARVIGERGT